MVLGKAEPITGSSDARSGMLARQQTAWVSKSAYSAANDILIACLQRNARWLLLAGHVPRSTGLCDIIEGGIGCKTVQSAYTDVKPKWQNGRLRGPDMTFNHGSASVAHVCHRRQREIAPTCRATFHTVTVTRAHRL